MKTQKILITAALILAITGTFTGCKKNDTVKKPVCRFLTETIVGSGPSLRFSYNSEGKVSRIVVDNGTVEAYSYNGDTTFLLVLNSGGAFGSKIIVTKNAAGLATNARTEYDATGTRWDNKKFEYNGNELIKATNTGSSITTPVITNYTWSNGNMVSENSGSGPITYDYYTDKPWQNGDYFSFAMSIQGFEIIRNKNLLKSFSSLLLTYDFGTDGNISTMKISSGTSSVNYVDYGYQCN